MSLQRAPAVPPHPFVAGGDTDWRGRLLCGQTGCGQPSDHIRHQLPDTDPAVVALEARRYPDREEEPSGDH